MAATFIAMNEVYGPLFIINNAKAAERAERVRTCATQAENWIENQ